MKRTRRDMVVFYAGLRSIDPNATKLIYAIVGLFMVDEVMPASDVPPERYDENATRENGNAATRISLYERFLVSLVACLDAFRVASTEIGRIASRLGGVERAVHRYS